MTSPNTGMTTPTSVSQAGKSFAMDVLAIAPARVLPNSVLIDGTTRAATIEGDAVFARIPAVSLDDQPDLVPEGEEFAVDQPDLAELLVATAKIGTLVKISREQLSQDLVSDIVIDAIKRAMLKKVDTVLLSQPVPTDGLWPPAGLLPKIPGTPETLADNLDALVDAIAEIEARGDSANRIVCNPGVWAYISKLKTTSSSNVSLLKDIAAEAPARQLLGVPVQVSAAMPDEQLVVYDRGTALSAYGQMELARSSEFYFGSDNVALRSHIRIGAGWLPGHEGIILSTSTG